MMLYAILITVSLAHCSIRMIGTEGEGQFSAWIHDSQDIIVFTQSPESTAKQKEL